MELSQWIALYGAVSQSAASRERSKWVLFASGLVTGALLLLVASCILVLGSASGKALGLGVASLGGMICFTWWVMQQRLDHESLHWHRLLRSLESQFAGAEFHRNIHRLLQGEQACVPSAAWVCGEWNPEAVRFPFFVRNFPRVLMQWLPGIFLAAFLLLIVGIAVGYRVSIIL